MTDPEAKPLPSPEDLEAPARDLEERRRFLERTAKLAITAPAVSLLLAASLKPEQAQAAMYQQDDGSWPDWL